MEYDEVGYPVNIADLQVQTGSSLLVGFSELLAYFFREQLQVNEIGDVAGYQECCHDD
ncbi:hypothetical protein D3C75_704400 [compost metagenome]